MSDRPYSRHYWDLVDDEKFADVYPDDHHYACWSRLLMIADQAWPASAHLPSTARRASVAKLAEVGLIELLPGGRFRVHGLQKERERRADHARKASIARWNAPGSASGNAPSIAGASAREMPSKEEKSREEQSRAETPPASDFDALDTYHDLTFYRPWGEWSGDELRALIRDYGNATVEAALREEHRGNTDRKTLLKRTQARLARDAEHQRRVAAFTPKRPAVDEAALREARRHVMGRTDA